MPCPDDNILSGYLEGTLPRQSTLGIEEHIESCEECRNVLVNLAQALPGVSDDYRFEVLRLLGAGGMGAVFEVHDNKLDSRVALKTLLSFSSPDLVQLKKEFRALHDIQHPNLVRLGELYSEGGTCFFTMDLVDGVNFLVYSRPEGKLDVDRLRTAQQGLVRGVAALHQAGKIHRDLKPSNVLVRPDGQAIILDFGLAIPELSSQQSRQLAGSVPYMSPEQALGEPVERSSDWYSVGVMLYEALTGMPAFPGEVDEVIREKQRGLPPSPKVFGIPVPSDLEGLGMDLMRIDPSSRPREEQILERLGLGDQPGLRLEVSHRTAPEGPFVGRQTELQTLFEAFDDSRRGETVSVVVRGNSGIGKSELVRRFAAALEAKAPGVQMFSGRCYEREFTPYKGIDGIADELCRHLGALDETGRNDLLADVTPEEAALLTSLFPVFLGIPALRPARPVKADEMDPHDRRRRMFESFRALLGRVAALAPTAIFLDDIQWASADSLALLTHLLTPPDTPQVLLVTTLRTDPEAKEPPALQPGEYVRPIQLGLLSPEATRELVLLLAPELEPSTVLIDSIVAGSRGHPLFVRELVEEARSADWQRTDVPRLEDILWRRVTNLPEAPRRILEMLAVSQGPVITELMAGALGLQSVELQRSLARLCVASLARLGTTADAGSAEIYHDRVRQAILSNLEARAIQELHVGLASELERSGAAKLQPHTFLRHLLAAGQRDRALQVALTAASRAAESLAFNQAADLYRIALDLSTDGDQVIRSALADALSRAGRLTEAARELEEQAARSGSPERLTLLHRAALHWFSSGHTRKGMRAVQTLRKETGIWMPRTIPGALASLVYNRLALRVRGLNFREVQEEDLPEDRLLKHETLWDISRGLGLIDPVRAMDMHVRSLREALRLGERKRIIKLLCIESGFVAAAGHKRLARAHKLLDRARELIHGDEDPASIGWLYFSEAFLFFCEGRFQKAAGRWEDTIRHLAEDACGMLPGMRIHTRNSLMWCLRILGEYQELQRMYDITVADARQAGDLHAEATILRSCNSVWLVKDDVQAAQADLDRVRWSSPPGSFHLQDWLELHARAELAVYRGSLAEEWPGLSAGFRRVHRSLLYLVQSVRQLALWLAGRVSLACIDSGLETGKHLKLVSNAARRMKRERTTFSQMTRVYLLAALAHQRGRRAAAYSLLESAEEMARTIGMPQYAAGFKIHRLRLSEEPQTGLIEEAHQILEDLGVRNTLRLVSLNAPGFKNLQE